MIEFINTNKNKKTKLDKAYTLSEDIIKKRNGFCHLHRNAFGQK